MIIIIGAGIAGVTLARCLKDNGVSFRIFDQQDEWKRQGWGLTVRERTTRELLPSLGMREPEFRKLVAVDRAQGATDNFLTHSNNGKLLGAGAYKKGIAQKDFRANRERLRSTIMGGVKVEYSHKLVNLEWQDGKIKADFENGVSVIGHTVVAADGMRSFIRGKLLPQCTPKDWDGIMINGCARFSISEYNDKLRPSMGDSTVKPGVGENLLLASTIYDMDLNPENGYVDVSWAYSRRPRGKDDPLYVSYLDKNFDKTKASPALWQELADLPRPLVDPFGPIYDRTEILNDGIIQHQMVSLLIPLEDLLQTLQDRNVVFIGDAVHDWSNHAGTAANTAILDSLALGRIISRGESLKGYYEERYSDWEVSFEKNGQDFEALHRPLKEWEEILRKEEAGSASEDSPT